MIEITPIVPPETVDDPNVIKFFCGNSCSEFPILELGPKDEIRVRGVLIERDYEVVEALRHFVKHGNVNTGSHPPRLPITRGDPK